MEIKYNIHVFICVQSPETRPTSPNDSATELLHWAAPLSCSTELLHWAAGVKALLEGSSEVEVMRESAATDNLQVQGRFSNL